MTSLLFDDVDFLSPCADEISVITICLLRPLRPMIFQERIFMMREGGGEGDNCLILVESSLSLPVTHHATQKLLQNCINCNIPHTTQVGAMSLHKKKNFLCIYIHKT
jgi:hypothetical protein